MKGLARRFIIVFLFLLLLGSISLESCKRPGDGSQSGSCCTHCDSVSTKRDSSATNQLSTYNIYIENSGSMKGYFSGNRNSNLETIIQEYFDRISENEIEGDTITLNYINTEKVNFEGDIRNYLSTAKSKCTESYTKIDDILSMAMQDAKDDVVNIVISDYCFETDNGNYETAQSEINKIFTQQLNRNKNLSIAILKYDANFDGQYFPPGVRGGIRCSQNMPVYFWIFGDANRVKKVLALNVKEKPIEQLLLQSSMTPTYSLNTSNRRAIDNNEIIVKHLKKERHEDAYKFEVLVDLSKSILNEQELKEKENYSLISSSASRYSISSIENNGDNYIFTISTDKPAPGSLTIKYDLKTPQWVEDSNYEGGGIPDNGKTAGIKYLIGGVYDAYVNKSDSYFTFNINLK